MLGAQRVMSKDTPSMAKNKMKRSLVAIYDPHPSKMEIDGLWEYFNSCCAYCDKPIDRASRTGHVDHLVPSSEGGSNNIHNYALACARCNGDEKREESWTSFLERKSDSSHIFRERKEKIEKWLLLAPSLKTDPVIAIEAEKIIEEAIKSFEHSVEKMRALRAKST